MTSQGHIEDWLRRTSERGYIEKQDVCFLMVHARHFIENSKNEYRVADLYVDWLVHSKLDRSYTGSVILQNITDILSRNWSSPSPNLALQVSETISLPRLQKELSSLFKEVGLSDEVFNEDNWKHVRSALLGYLINKPLFFSDRIKSKTKEKSDVGKIQEGIWIESLTISNVEDQAFWTLQLKGDKELKITGPLLVKTAEE